MGLRVKDCRARLPRLESLRQPHLQNWTGISNLMLPRRGLFLSLGLSAAQAKERYKRIINSTGMDALRLAAMGTHQLMTSASLDWLGLDFEDQGMNRWPRARRWIDQVVDVFYRVFRDSNFYQVTQGADHDFWAFSNAQIMAWPHPRKVVSYELVPPGQWCWALDRYGEVDTLYRQYPMSARNLVAEFGRERVSERARRAAEQRPDEELDVVMVVEPREAGRVVDGSPMASEMPFRVAYFEAASGDEDHFLREGGCPEWPGGSAVGMRVGADPYGEGPGHDVQYDVAMLQGIDRDLLLAIQTAARPPMLLPPGLKNKARFVPGGFTYASAGEAEAVRELYKAQLQLGPAQAKLEEVEAKVRRALYNDVFLIYREQRSNVTAREIAELAGEKMVFLGAVVDQIKNQIEQLVDRTFGLCQRAGLLPEPPRELLGQTLRVNLRGPLAQAQRAAGLKPNRELLAEVAGMAQLWPGAVEMFDHDAYLRRQQELGGANAELLRTPEQLKELAEARAQQQAQAAQGQAAQELLAGAKQMADIPMDKANMLTALTGQMQGRG